MLAFNLPRQAGETVQQLRLVIARGRPNGLCQLGKLPLGCCQHAIRFARSRQTHQRRHAIGLNFNQLLHQPAHAALRHAPWTTGCKQNHTRKTVRVNRKIRKHLTLLICNAGAYQRVFVQQVLDQFAPCGGKLG